MLLPRPPASVTRSRALARDAGEARVTTVSPRLRKMHGRSTVDCFYRTIFRSHSENLRLEN